MIGVSILILMDLPFLFDTYQQKDCDPINKKIDTPINKKIEDNNTRYNNTDIIIKK